MSDFGARWVASSDAYLVEQIVSSSIAVGQTFTIDDIRPQLTAAGINPLAFGPLLYALLRAKLIERVDSIHRTRRHGYNGGHRGMWRRCAPTHSDGDGDA
jgi:hypothetical protein